MKSALCVLTLAILALSPALGGADEKLTYYVQLIHGNDEDKPAAPSARLVGPKLSNSLHSIFRWKNYWEISRQEVVVVVGARTNVVLNKERTVEIDLSQTKKRKVTAISRGTPVCTSTQPLGELMTIIGADRDTNTAWFVVVRRDKPPSRDGSP